MNELRSLKGPAQIVVALLLANVALSGVSILSAGMQIELLQRMEVGDYGYAEPLDNDQRQQLVAIAGLGLLIVTAVGFLTWFRRAYDNVAAVGRPVPSDRGGPIASWFIPFLNLVRPFKIASEIWARSDPQLEVGDEDVFVGDAPPWLTAWWAAWIAGGLLGNAVARIEEPTAAAYAQILSDLVGIVSALLAAQVVRRITARQEGLLADRDPEPAVF